MPPDFSFESLSYTSLSQRGNLDSVNIQHPYFCAEVLLQGAQLISFTPNNRDDWLWLSPLEKFTQGQAVRGGIPICLPWFGVNRHAQSPLKHGFIRNNDCQLENIVEAANSVTLHFSYHYHPTTNLSKPALFPSEFIIKLAICLQASQPGEETNEEASITYEFELEHLSQYSQTYSYAFHCYFNVPGIQHSQVSGLDQHAYLDNTDNLSCKNQQGAIRFNTEVDRVYQATTQPQSLHTNERLLIIDAVNAPSCIVWNPHDHLAQSIPDIQQHVKNFVCIERGCAFSDEIQLKEGQRHCSTMTINLTRAQ